MNNPLKHSPPPLFGHPLSILPWLRDRPESIPRDLLYTLYLALFATLILTVAGILNTPRLVLWVALPRLIYIHAVMSLCCGFSIHSVSFIVGRSLRRWLPQLSVGTRSACMVLAAILGGATGYWLGSRLLGLQFSFMSGMFLLSLWGAALLTGITISYRRVMQSELAYERERSARIEAERLMTVARLQTLQAQIEPHFLFNTLANVSSLIESEPKQARKMLDELTVLLRAALDAARQTTTRLRKELQVVEAYLGVLKVRMGERLHFRIDAEPELLELNVPSMLLQPIVENAVKHGIEPRVQGGTVRIEVKREGAQLLFVVADDGVGFAPHSKENVGLGAVRERLAVQFGDSASLRTDRADGWTRVAIRIPMPQ